MKFYNALCPYYQNNMIEIRQSEPYSYSPVCGRKRPHSIRTGTSSVYDRKRRLGLFFRNQIYAWHPAGFEHLTIDPCIPADWKEFSAVRRWRGAEYDIHVENPDGVMKGVQELYLDGEKVERIPVMAQGSRHDVRVVMG